MPGVRWMCWANWSIASSASVKGQSRYPKAAGGARRGYTFTFPAFVPAMNPYDLPRNTPVDALGDVAHRNLDYRKLAYAKQLTR